MRGQGQENEEVSGDTFLSETPQGELGTSQTEPHFP